MDFRYDEKQMLIQKMARDFALQYAKPLAQETDEQERFPKENVEVMKQNGFFGIPFPKEYGGASGDYMSYILTVYEISKACATTGVILSAHTSLCAAPIYEHGTMEQKERYLTRLATGESLGAFGLTEPDAGTDASAQQTKAKKVEGGYLLNGSKIFITNAGVANIYVVFAMTDQSLGLKGISAFIVEDTFSGFSIGKKEKKMGIRGSATCELIFKDCFVPEENLLGKENQGFQIAMKTLDGGRIGIAAQALGIAEGALDESITYVKGRKQFGRPLSKFQNTQFELAKMYASVEGAKQLVMKAAWLKDQNESYSVAAATAKLVASTTAMEVTTKAVQLFGGYGYTREYPVERMMRDAKITEIYEGTSEVQKMVIAGKILK